jgi:hypothetical protein
MSAVKAVISSTDIFSKHLKDNPGATFDEVTSSTDDTRNLAGLGIGRLKPHEMRKAEYRLTRIWLEMAMNAPWRQGLNFETIGKDRGWFGARHIDQGMFRGWLKKIPVGSGNAWDNVVDPVARYQNEEIYDDIVQVADDIGLIALRDYINDSVLLEFLEGVLAIGGLIVLGIGGAPVVATVALTGAAAIALTRGIALLSSANSLEEAFGAVWQIFIAFTLKGGASGANWLGASIRNFSGFLRAFAALNSAKLTAWFVKMAKTPLSAAAAVTFNKILSSIKAFLKMILDAVATSVLIIDEFDNASARPSHWAIPDHNPFGDNWFGKWVAKGAKIEDIHWEDEEISGRRFGKAKRRVVDAVENGDITIVDKGNIIINNAASGDDLYTDDLITLGAVQVIDDHNNDPQAVKDALEAAEEAMSRFEKQYKDSLKESVNKKEIETILSEARFQKLAGI